MTIVRTRTATPMNSHMFVLSTCVGPPQVAILGDLPFLLRKTILVAATSLITWGYKTTVLFRDRSQYVMLFLLVKDFNLSQTSKIMVAYPCAGSPTQSGEFGKDPCSFKIPLHLTKNKGFVWKIGEPTPNQTIYHHVLDQKSCNISPIPTALRGQICRSGDAHPIFVYQYSRISPQQFQSHEIHHKVWTRHRTCFNQLSTHFNTSCEDPADPCWPRLCPGYHLSPSQVFFGWLHPHKSSSRVNPHQVLSSLYPQMVYILPFQLEPIFPIASPMVCLTPSYVSAHGDKGVIWRILWMNYWCRMI